MTESATLALAPNINKTNILDADESICNRFDQEYSFQESSTISSILADFDTFNINDENRFPKTTLPKANNSIQTDDDVAALKAELEATRRKLANYETRSNTATQPLAFTYTQSSRNCFPSDSSTIDFPPNDILPWSDYDSTLTDIPPPPHPSPVDFPTSVPPLRIPSANVSLQAPVSGSNINSSISPFLSGLTVDTVYPPRDEHRSFSLPYPGPIGEARRTHDVQRAFSADHKGPRTSDAWKSCPDWTSSWSDLSMETGPRQLTGTASLGINYNDPSPWNEASSHLI
jgi:hypothetical protein